MEETESENQISYKGLTKKDLQMLQEHVNREGCYMILSDPDLIGQSIFRVIERIIDSQRDDAKRSGIALAQYEMQKVLGLKN